MLECLILHPQSIKIATLYGLVDIDEEMASLMVNN
jgi:hypothetical protein